MAREKDEDGKKDAGKGAADRHERARNLAEGALDQYASGRDEEGDRLLDEAERLDPSAVEEVAEELEEDAGADPEAARKADRGGGSGKP